jgi:ribonuclease HI
LLNLRVGSSADVFSDSQLLVNQFSGEWAVRDPSLARLLRRIHEIIEERQLKLTLSWIPREQNLAGKLLERGYRSSQGRAQNKLQKLHL